MQAVDHLTGLTQARLKALLHYDPETGEFTWLVWRPNGIKVGDVAGAHNAQSYRKIRVDGHTYTATRLAWLYMTGSFPVGVIDHRDTNKFNDRWDNLRESTHTENQRNVGLTSRNTSGLKGAFYHSERKQWRSAIRVNGDLIHLGCFLDARSAHAAYSAAADKYFGPYARSA